MFEELHDQANIGRGLPHLVDEDHLSNHQRRQDQAHAETAHDNEREPGNCGGRLQLDNPGLVLLVKVKNLFTAVKVNTGAK